MTKKNTHAWTYHVFFCNWTDPETGKFQSHTWGKSVPTREEAERLCKYSIAHAQHCYFDIYDAGSKLQERWLLDRSKKWKVYYFAEKKKEIVACV